MGYSTSGQVQVVAGWVLGWVNHFGTEPATQVSSAWAIRLWVGPVSTWQKLGGKQAHCVRSDSVVWLSTSETEISAEVWEAAVVMMRCISRGLVCLNCQTVETFLIFRCTSTF